MRRQLRPPGVRVGRSPGWPSPAPEPFSRLLQHAATRKTPPHHVLPNDLRPPARLSTQLASTPAHAQRRSSSSRSTRGTPGLTLLLLRSRSSVGARLANLSSMPAPAPMAAATSASSRVDAGGHDGAVVHGDSSRGIDAKEDDGVGGARAGGGYVTLSFYRFVRLPPSSMMTKDQEFENPHHEEGARRKALERLRLRLLDEWTPIGAVGRVYVADEGINAQMSVPLDKLRLFQESLARHPEVFGPPGTLRLNMANDSRPQPDVPAFRKLRVKVRSQIVSAQDDMAFPALVEENAVANGDQADKGPEHSGHRVESAGRHLTAEQWHAMMDSPGAVVVDVRNHYESEVGRFESALTPNVSTYKESFTLIRDMLKGKEGQPILMYCTGGIRCEKMSLYLHEHGFQNVNQLKGGIVSYAREVREKGLTSRFLGKNFSFDDRLGETVTDDVLSVCHQCGTPCNDHTNCINDACSHLFIQCTSCKEKHKGTCGSDECVHTTLITADELRQYLKQRGASSFAERVQRRLPFANTFPSRHRS